MLDLTRQTGYQTVPFSVYIHNLMFSFWSECSETSSWYSCEFTTYRLMMFSRLKQLIVPFSVYIHSLMFFFFWFGVLLKESTCVCEFTTYMHRLIIPNNFLPETDNVSPN